jgi:D-glycero-D-manno-heptose 1,7-bisphosphate phosphatase
MKKMTKKSKAVFVDKDGTLIPDIPYNVDTSLITLEHFVAEGLLALQCAGYKIVIISNQSGIARGLFTAGEFHAVQVKLEGLLTEHGISLHGFYYCPHYPGGSIAEYSKECDCRKPKPGLLLHAAQELMLDLGNSWMIGDILNDVQAGKSAGCRTILIDNGNETDWIMNEARTPDFIAGNFKEAAKYVLIHECVGQL